MTVFRSSIFAVVAALSVANNGFAAAFVPTLSSRTAPTRARTPFIVTKMAEGDDNFDGAQLTSARKELKFDDATGRFYETNLDADDCIPDEEFCTLDEETGQRIRLTVAEKERIFLDALQVCICHDYIIFVCPSFFVSVLYKISLFVCFGGLFVASNRILTPTQNLYAVLLREWKTTPLRRRFRFVERRS